VGFLKKGVNEEKGLIRLENSVFQSHLILKEGFLIGQEKMVA
jgi:hypothetical protein